jgi:hypothetical protein
MSTALAAPAASLGRPTRLFQPDSADRRARTLEDAVMATVETRRLRGRAACLVCGEETPGPGECRSCGSELS